MQEGLPVLMKAYHLLLSNLQSLSENIFRSLIISRKRRGIWKLLEGCTTILQLAT